LSQNSHSMQTFKILALNLATTLLYSGR